VGLAGSCQPAGHVLLAGFFVARGDRSVQFNEIGDRRRFVTLRDSTAGDERGKAIPALNKGEYTRRVAAVHAQLSDQSFAAACARGHPMTRVQAIEYALVAERRTFLWSFHWSGWLTGSFRPG